MVRMRADASPAPVVRAVQAACNDRPQALMLRVDAANAQAVIRTAR